MLADHKKGTGKGFPEPWPGRSVHIPNRKTPAARHQAVSGLWCKTLGGDYPSSLQAVGEAFIVTFPSLAFLVMASVLYTALI